MINFDELEVNDRFEIAVEHTSSWVVNVPPEHITLAKGEIITIIGKEMFAYFGYSGKFVLFMKEGRLCKEKWGYLKRVIDPVLKPH